VPQRKTVSVAYRQIPGGAPLAGTAELHELTSDTLVASVATDADGVASFPAGYPGGYEARMTAGSPPVSKVVVGEMSQIVAGVATVDLPEALRAFASGIVAGITGELAVSPAGGLTVGLATGAAINYGRPFVRDATQTDVLTLAAANPTNPRYDLVVLRLELVDSGSPTRIKWRHRPVVITGTPAATPIEPPPVVSANEVDLPLAAVRVPAGAAALVAGNVEDRRRYAAPNVLDFSVAYLGGVLPLANGGTGGTTAGAARTNLGLGTLATQNANAAAISGGSVVGITDLAVADGGTGASTAAAARTNLGLAAGGAGDIWVEKAGDVMPGILTLDGTLIVNHSSASAVDISTAGGATRRVRLDTVGGMLKLMNGTRLLLYSDDNLTNTGTIDGANGDAQFDGTLDVNGAATFNGAVTLGNAAADTVTLTGRVRAPGGNPSAAVGAGAGAGATIASVSGSDTAGDVEINTGTGTSTGNLATITFNTARPDANYEVILTRQTSASANSIPYATSKTATDFVIGTGGAAPTASSTIRVGWWVVGRA
jgi:hypothetical protein